jgi:hypothetical protein
LLNDDSSGGFGPGPGWSARLSYTATTTGTYYLASNAEGDETGTYKISATVLSTTLVDDYAASTATTGVVAIGGSTTGNIETTGDADWFKVTLTAGTTYQLDLQGSATGQGTLQHPFLELLDSGGHLLLSDDSSGGFGPGPGWSARLSYTATTTGTYYLASNAEGNETGTYKISATSLDTTAPVVNERLANDTGSSSSDKITSNPALAGSGDPNAVVHFTVDGSPIAATATATSSGAWSFTPSGLTDGSHTIVASETDTVGNTGTASLTFTLDTTPPTVAITSAGGLTSHPTQTVSGTVDVADAGTIVTLYDGTTALGTATVQSNGSWSTSITVTGDGTHTLTATDTDAAGNTGTSNAVIYTLQAALPLISASQIQAEDFAITRATLPLDQATAIANSINSGAQTEVQFINNLLSQVADTTIPAVAVEGSMYGAVGTSAEVTLLATQFLPAQVANATQHGYNPVVYASEALGLVFAFGNENGGTAFAINFGPSNAAMSNTATGDAAFAAAAASAIFGSAANPNTPGAILGFVSNWEAFYTSHGIPGIAHPTAAQIDLAARGAAWGDAVGVALANNLGPLNGQAMNFLEDAAEGTAIYSTSLSSQPNHAPFAANSIQLTGVAAHVDHTGI